MLCQFTFSNFKSYKNEVTLDLCPANISEHHKTLIPDNYDGTKYLPVAVIYGPNGGGKSNVIEAFFFLRKTVLTTPRIDDNDSLFEKGSQLRTIQKTHFLFDDNQAELPSSFEIIFRTEKYEYKYILKVKNELVIEENLYATEIQSDMVILVFERSKDRIKLGDLLDGVQADNINIAMPLIQHLAVTYNFDITKDMIAWFKAAKVVNYGNFRSESTMGFPETKEEKQRFFDILHEMDISINDILIDRNEDGKVEKVLTEYQLENKGNYFIDFFQESAGTRKLLSFLFFLLNALEKGSALFADELDAKLHPKMIEYIITLFTNPATNKHGAQLIFTSHDLHTMNNSIFRRDEIWFAAKGADLSSRLYSLSEFKKGAKKPRKDESYGKQYIEGRYGADPYLKKIIDWEAWHEQEASKTQ